MEPSPTPIDTQAIQEQASSPQANGKGQEQDPPIVEEVQPSGDPSFIYVQGQVQDGHDSDDEGDDQAISQETLEEMLARRAKRRQVNLKRAGHTEDKIIGKT